MESVLTEIAPQNQIKKRESYVLFEALNLLPPVLLIAASMLRAIAGWAFVWLMLALVR
jgi:hypothetical protein